MSKTYKEITPIEALKRLAEAGKPIDGLMFRDDSADQWRVGVLTGVSPYCQEPFHRGYDTTWAQCAEPIEEAPKPWTFESAPKGLVLTRSKSNPIEIRVVISWDSHGIYVGGGFRLSYRDLVEFTEHSLDNGNTWRPCHA